MKNKNVLPLSLFLWAVFFGPASAQGFFKKTDAASAPAAVASKAPAVIAAPMPKPLPPAPPAVTETVVSKPTMPPAAPMPLPRQEQVKAGPSVKLPTPFAEPKPAGKPQKLSVLEQSKLDVRNASVLAKKNQPEPRKLSSEAGKVPAAASQTVTAAAAPLVPVSQAAKNPKASCGDLNFVAQAVCISFQCVKDDFKSHPECVAMAEQQQARKNQEQFR